MNKVGLSISILSLSWFISTTGWGGEFISNNFFSSKKVTPDNTPVQNNQPTATAMPPPLECGQTITITDSDGKVTTIKKTCDDNRPPLCCLGSKK